MKLFWPRKEAEPEQRGVFIPFTIMDKAHNYSPAVCITGIRTQDSALPLQLPTTKAATASLLADKTNKGRRQTSTWSTKKFKLRQKSANGAPPEAKSSPLPIYKDHKLLIF